MTIYGIIASQRIRWDTPFEMFGSAALTLSASATATLVEPIEFDSWNPDDKHADVALTNNNLTATSSAVDIYTAVRSIRSHINGKKYFEVQRVTSADGAGIGFGLATAVTSLDTFLGDEGGAAWSAGYFGDVSGSVFYGSSGFLSTGRVWSNSEWGAWAVDLDAGKAWMRDASGWQGDPVAGTGAITFTPGLTLYAAASFFSQNDQVIVNLGESAFQYAIPTGFISWSGRGILAGSATITLTAAGDMLTAGDDLVGTAALSFSATGSMGDPNFANVVFLAGLEGADGATTYNEEKNSRAATFVGNAQIDTGQFKYGTSSLQVDGSGDRITFAHHDDWHLASTSGDPFTVEFWVRFNTLTSSNATIMGKGSGSEATWYIAGTFTPGNLEFVAFEFDVGTQLTVTTTGAGLTTGVWYHVAVCRNSSNKLRIFVDGVMRGSESSAGAWGYFVTAAPLVLGARNTSGTSDMDGWIDEVRITLDVCRYDSDSSFTPPTAAFPRS